MAQKSGHTRESYMERFTDFFIKRPVFALVVSLFILLIGLMSYQHLTIRQYPKIDASVITIKTTYPGANAKTMEGFVSTPIENAINGIDGLDFITSQSSAGTSTVTANFKLGYPVDIAITDIGNRVDSVRDQLPQDIKPPIISKEDPSAQPTMFISFSSKTKTPEEITDYIVRVVQPQFQVVDGVSQVGIFGGHTYALRVWLNPEKMAGFGLTAQDVLDALNHSNIQGAAGKLKNSLQELNLIIASDLTKVEEFNQLIISQRNGQPIRVQDIGYAELGSQEITNSVVIDDEQSVVIAIIPKSTANPLEVSQGITKVFSHIQQNLPQGVNSAIRWDTSRFIKESLVEVRNTIFEAAFFVVMVIFLFLGSIRATMIPLVTIPLSLIGACIIMFLLNYTINTLTLLAFVLAIGLVVDDAIVVLENIHRHIEQGLSSLQAALTATREIGFAIIAMTFTLAAVYTPLGFTEGLTGALFREFAFTLAGSVIISGIIALTLSPMMCSKILTTHNPKLSIQIEKYFHALQTRYQQTLTKAITRKNCILFAAVAIFIYIFGFLLHFFLKEELAPNEDQGAILTFTSAPVAAGLNYLEKYSADLPKIYKTLPEEIGYGVISGFNAVNKGISFVVLKSWDERTRKSSEIIGELFGKYSQLIGITAFPTDLPPLPSTGYFPIEFVIKTIGSYEELYAYSQKLLKELSKNQKLINVDTDLKYSQPQINITIDRNKAADLGIKISDITATLNTALSEPTVTRFSKDGRSYEVIPKVLPQYAFTPDNLQNFNVRTTSGKLVPLANVIQVKDIIAPESLNHFQQLRAVKITASLIPGYAVGDALNDIVSLSKKILPTKFEYDFDGTSRQFMEASGTLQFALTFALLFIFLVLSAQFESFLRPFIVLTCVPLSLTGALITLFFVDGTLNIYTKIGLVTLVGLISKHGILLVDFAHRQQNQGLAVKEAIIQAASLRLRPILMTTAAMILGSLPLILNAGAGNEARRQIGWVIVGGMSFGTILTLFIVPAVYYLIYFRNKTNDLSKS
jgi:multidrug efflux pump